MAEVAWPCRDVKPSNILLTEDGHAKVSDMGLSRADFFSSSAAFAGTFKYAAPELLLGRPSNEKVWPGWDAGHRVGLGSLTGAEAVQRPRSLGTCSLGRCGYLHAAPLLRQLALVTDLVVRHCGLWSEIHTYICGLRRLNCRRLRARRMLSATAWSCGS